MSDAPDELLAANAEHAAGPRPAGLAAEPKRSLAVVACMDARIDVLAALGLEVGDAHVIRNAGGIVTDDVIRSLTLSQRRLQTREIVLVHHTRCGVQNLDEDGLRRELEADAGETPVWSTGTFADPFGDVAESVDRLRSCRFLVHRDRIRGFVYDVDTGRLLESNPDIDPGGGPTG